MSASSSDSWVLIAITILVVLLLFYLSKKMICNSYRSSSSEESPTTTTTTSPSTTFSDYNYYEGRSPLDLLDVGTATSSGSGGSETGGDLAIDIADSFDYSGDHRQHHYRVDNRYPCNNNNGNNNNGRNYLNLSNSVTCNGGRMSGDGIAAGDAGVGRTARTTVGIGSANGWGDDNNNNNNNNNRRMDSSGLPLTSSTLPTATTATGSQLPILLPISIIASPDLDRKTMLETQLRNQIAKIVQAEREIQRLVQLLAVAQREGLDSENNNTVAATEASLLRHHQRYPQFYQHVRGLVSPATISTLTTSTTTPSSLSTVGSTTTESASMPARMIDSVSTGYYNSNTNNNNIPSSLHHQENVSDTEDSTSRVVPDNHGDDHYHHDHHHQNSSTSNETTSPGNHHHHHLYYRRPHHHHHHQNCPCLSDFLLNSNSMQRQATTAQQQHEHQLLAASCGGTRAISSSQQPRSHQCACNLCYSTTTNIGTRARRMLMLRRMLLPTFPASFPIVTNANLGVGEAATGAQGDFLARSPDSLAYDLHYPREEQQQQQYHRHQRVPDPQSHFCDYSHQQQQHHHLRENDDPPPYDECIRSNSSSREDDNDYHQNISNNNNCIANSNSSSCSSTATALENQDDEQSSASKGIQA